MKIPSLLALFGATLLASSCRTEMPTDPMTMKPAPECLPGNFPSEGGHSGK